MATLYDECHLFGILRTSLLQDLMILGFQVHEAGKILNWFDPASDEYLRRVDEWQAAMCRGSASLADVELPLERMCGNRVSILRTQPHKIRAVHQIAKLCYKWHGDPRNKTDMAAVKTRLSQPCPISLDSSEVRGIRECLSGIRPPSLNSIIGRYGPGATFERFNNFEKWSRLGLIPNVPPELYRVNARDPWAPVGYHTQPTTRIVEVPKSIKSNRIVSSEPAMYMAAQLAVNDYVCDHMHKLFAGRVSLQDQARHNENLLRTYACSIDLSDASDHVSCALVMAVLPQLWPVLASVRSSHALFPDGEELRLATFAPMGSGVCFSTMTLVILGICAYAEKCVRARSPWERTWYSVYGDDIIIPFCMYDDVVSLLQKSGLVINDRKSCYNFRYRESCGLELFGRENITPVYIRDPLEASDASHIESVVSRLDANGFWNTSAKVMSIAAPARAQRYNRALQRREVSVRAPLVRQTAREVDSWAGLYRWFATRTQGQTWYDRRPPGVSTGVRTVTGWRWKASCDYPFTTAWLDANGNVDLPRRKPRK